MKRKSNKTTNMTSYSSARNLNRISTHRKITRFAHFIWFWVVWSFCYQLTMLLRSNGFMVNSQVILLEMAKFEVFTKSSGMRTHIPKALVVTVLGPQNDHNTNAAKSLRSFAKQLEISGVKVRKTNAE